MFTHRIDSATYLKLLEPQDSDKLYQLIDSSREHLRQWLPWVDQNTSVEHSRQFIQHTLDQFASNNGFTAGIWYQGALAGVIGFHKIDWQNRSTSLGYWLGEEYTGLGLMQKAVSKSLDYAFLELRLNRVEIRSAIGNVRSRRIPEKLNFTLEGTIRQAEKLVYGYVNHNVYGMLLEDWEAKENSKKNDDEAKE
ncbi:RimJ/RimL family protein N-acetyltransferase [Terribacillus saccharophilus]|jgi:ribosomal-protein-serine acetyltransferase|uniref:RimJ/RimL family protein N-acetyltransferase n=1 Tax=Terribacillus saccharophilus TaxID=361277 RepID=A0A268HBN9_9BACI|nr:MULTISPECIES: GNAT family protein [Terribacillus]PAD35589.1 RimJ/RimL family protein N-acetyltransferase [Terribacillus saccharophilus]PAD96450.1 RimJ/RimL family protein N-acetyltransferase [Terribacillus saccharophilus]PAE00026.1 RimJ/RimL family protein N-acetyltransferase [Terribacillus saccharophilus]PAE07278.1 RimJ/RimL family protein N-acetyltransferase [Terribacillus saccharophilus]VVM34403.1 Ribosomal-protein-L7p-serine acetyltransferase [Terribacillus sp. AE2B 122]